MGQLRKFSCAPAGLVMALAAVMHAPAAAQELPEPGEPFSFCERLARTVPERILRAEEQRQPPRGIVLDIAACLGHPDPELRDAFAYTTLAELLRGGQVSEGERRELLHTLLTNLNSYVEDPNGFLKPFTILALSEVARTDRIQPWMSAGEREQLLEAGAGYLEGVMDYRGFREGEGWRHGVAHGADLLMQLSLNRATRREGGDRVLKAVAAQIASDTAPAYVFDEPRRLSRPLLALVERDLYSEEELTAWFEALAQPAPLDDWGEAFTSESALARRHNLRAFGYVVLAAANESAEESALRTLRPGALHLLTVIP